ncbi:ABC transporter substrate-binding protein [Nocardioides sp. GCM10030258]|uniref:ABC transporter substrate-binding protein n=1 Tax=unclassified Nocardioides TaxID=2615069 RepID=UPI003616A566
MSERSKLSLAVAAALMLLPLAGCADRSSGSNRDSTSVDPSDVLTPDKASGEPVKLGFFNPSRGATAQPEAVAGARAAVHYINDYYGGIEGRPIELLECEVDATPESIVSCANKFVEDEVVAATSAATINDGAALPILDEAKIPLVGYAGASFESVFSQTALFFGPSIPSSTIVPFQFFKDEGAKSVAFIFGDIPANHDYVDAQFTPIAKALDLDFRPVYYDMNNVNWTTVAASLIVTDADVVGVPSLPEDQCTDLVKALVDQGYQGTIQAGACTEFAESVTLPDSTKAYITAGLWLPVTKDAAPVEAQDQLDIFEASVIDAGETASNTYAVAAFSVLVTLTDILNDAQAELTPAGIDKAVRAAKEAPSFLGAPVTCDHSVWPGQSACSNSVLVLEAEAGGSFVPATDPPFTTTSPAVLGQ